MLTELDAALAEDGPVTPGLREHARERLTEALSALARVGMQADEGLARRVAHAARGEREAGVRILPPGHPRRI